MRQDSHTRQYRGARDVAQQAHVYVAWIDAQVGTIETPLRHHPLHSDGFEWGYEGHGPLELARCMLIDHYHGPVRRPPRIDFEVPFVPAATAERFMKSVIARQLDRTRPWIVSDELIDHWLVIRKLASKQEAREAMTNTTKQKQKGDT